MVGLSTLWDTYFPGGKDHRMERCSAALIPYLEGDYWPGAAPLAKPPCRSARKRHALSDIRLEAASLDRDRCRGSLAPCARAGEAENQLVTISEKERQLATKNAKGAAARAAKVCFSQRRSLLPRSPSPPPPAPALPFAVGSLPCGAAASR